MTGAARRAELQQRCVAQREQLAQAVDDIEQRLNRVDRWLGSVTTAISKPAMIGGVITALFTLRRIGWWRTLGRGVVMWVTVRRLLQWAKRL